MLILLRQETWGHMDALEPCEETQLADRRDVARISMDNWTVKLSRTVMPETLSRRVWGPAKRTGMRSRGCPVSCSPALAARCRAV